MEETPYLGRAKKKTEDKLLPNSKIQCLLQRIIYYIPSLKNSMCEYFKITILSQLIYKFLCSFIWKMRTGRTYVLGLL